MRFIIILLTGTLFSPFIYATNFATNFTEELVGAKPASSNSFFKWGSSVRTEVSDERAYSGGKSLKFTFPGDPDLSKDSFSEQRFELDKKYTELWFRYKLWIPENYRHRSPEGPDNNKGLLMLWGESYNGYAPTLSLHFQRSHREADPDQEDSYIYSAWRANSHRTLNIKHQHNDRSFTLGITSEDRGTWIDWVIKVKTSTIDPDTAAENQPRGNGIVQVWKNGNILWSITDATNYYGGGASDPGGVGDGWNYGYLLGWANSGFDETTIFYLDDFLVGTTPEAVNFEENKPIFETVIRVDN